MICLSCVRFDSDPALMLDAQKVVYSFKTLLSLRVIDSTDIHEGLELALGVIPQECKHGNKTRRRNIDC